MCHFTATNATPDDALLSFARPVDTAMPDPEPPRRPASLTAMLDSLAETRSAIDLVLLAASLRQQPSSSLGGVLEIAAGHLVATADALRAHAAAGEA